VLPPGLLAALPPVLDGRSKEPGRLPPVLFAPEFPKLPRLPELELFVLAPARLPLKAPLPFELVPRELLLKKCWELDGTLRRALELAVRPDGLKLSRDGEIGILPDTALAWRTEAPSNRCWLRGTAPWPKSWLDIELMPPCRRESRVMPSTFENRRPPKRSPASGP
jgi:hypothetical protein